jgi:PAS domain S-box-containing protein
MSERGRTQQRLTEALELNQAMLATSSIGILAFRATGPCVFANAAAGHLIGARVEQLLAQSFRHLRSWQQSGLLTLAEETLRAGKPQRSEVHVVTTFGKDVWWDCQMASFVSGGEAHLLVMNYDISERKRMEKTLRASSRRLQEAQDEERRRIARELHDRTAQGLAGAIMSLGRLEDLLPGEDGPARQLLQDSLALLNQCSQEVRTCSYLLHPPFLDQMGLIAALGSYLEGFARRSGLEVTMSAPPGPRRLPREVELALFRIVQEALGNVHRHSGSRTARVQVAFTPGQVSVEVSDDGRGLPAETLTGSQAGLGLTSMRGRMDQLGGRLEIESSGRGTSIRAIIPSLTTEP